MKHQQHNIRFKKGPHMFQICYASKATHAFSDLNLADLLAISRKNNRALNLSGLLLYTHGSFIQVLEGEDPVVIAKYNHIRRDPRHADLMILFKSQIETRSFADWDMGFIQSDKQPPIQIPGFQDFFSQNFSPTAFRKGADRARLALLQFRDGLWRRAVSF